MDVRVGLWRRLSTEELMLLNCGVGEDSWESLGLQGDPTVHPKGDQSWMFIGRTDAEAETLILWPPHAKCWLIGKESDAGRDWGQEEKGTTEDEMAGWHHGLDGRNSEWTPGVGDGQGGLACCNSWGCKELDTTEQLNWTELNWMVGLCQGIRPVCGWGVLSTPLVVWSAVDMHSSLLLLLIPCFCSRLIRSGYWVSHFFASFYQYFAPTAHTCTQLFLVPYSFFAFCCWGRGLSRCKHWSKGTQVPVCFTFSPSQCFSFISLCNRGTEKLN